MWQIMATRLEGCHAIATLRWNMDRTVIVRQEYPVNGGGLSQS